MQLDRDGAQHFPAAFNPAEAAELAGHLSLPQGRPGARLAATLGLAALLGPANAVATAFLGPGCRAVGAKLFDKSPERNWALGWHQDRTIAVHERRDVPGFDQWTVKAGMAHCVPPFEILERSLTLRVHLDAAGEANAPLRIALGSHRLGAVADPEIAAAVDRCGSFACLAETGDVWAYCAPSSTPPGAQARRRAAGSSSSTTRPTGCRAGSSGSASDPQGHEPAPLAASAGSPG